MSREQLAAAGRKIEELHSHVCIQESMSAYDSSGFRRFGGLCSKCGQREALIAAGADSSSIITQLSRYNTSYRVGLSLSFV